MATESAITHDSGAWVPLNGVPLNGVPLDAVPLYAAALACEPVQAQVQAAQSLPELQAAAQAVEGLVLTLHRSGVRIEHLAQGVTTWHRQLLRSLWALLAPPGVVQHSCLLVLGSEGRGEQLLKTDQDNALLLPDELACDGLPALAESFNAAVVRMGWPLCPGRIMLSNPLWRQTVSGFRATVRGWVFDDASVDPDGALHLAIFMDASAVAGDARLLATARAELFDLVAGQDRFLARFAAAADQFHEPGGWFSRLTHRHDELPLDLKKLGVFPLVHGVRALALQHRVQATNTGQRLRALVADGWLQEMHGRDLLQALHLLMDLRLTQQLAQREAGTSASNEVKASSLSRLERESLRSALAIVKEFRSFLRHHFRFD